jgi:acyl carrier protein
MRLEDLIGRTLGVEANVITETTSNQTLAEWDSLAHITLVTELEAAYGVALSTEDALAMTSVGAIRRVLADRGVNW